MEKKIIFILIVLLFIPTFVYAEQLNISDETKASYCINSSIEIMKKMKEEGFSVIRINDSISNAQTIFDLQQKIKKESRGKEDYSRIFSICEEISNLNSLAYSLRDQINSLEKFYNENSKEIRNSSKIDELFLKINTEMKNERYELVPEIIEKTYNEIAIAKSQSTILFVFYDATTKSFKRFILERWKGIVVVFFILIFSFLVFNKPIRKFILKRELFNLELRKKSLKEMIAKNQEDYFNKGKISEMEFTIKNKKLSELIRDIERQISLVKEQLAQFDKNGIKNIKK